MFKCMIIRVTKFHKLQETIVHFKVSGIGNHNTDNHKLVGVTGNNRFILGQIDTSIKVGDLLRCDGLPYTSKPVRTINTKYNKDSSGKLVLTKYVYGIPEGYSPVQLDSGYWVLRKDGNISKRKKVTTK